MQIFLFKFIYIVLFVMIGYVLGRIYNIKKTYGVILVDHETNNLILKMNSNDIIDKKMKKVVLSIIHDANISQK